MERLTKTKINLGFIDSKTLPSYEAVYKRLRKYEDLEEQGKLLKLPCAVGGKIYLPNEYVGKVIDFEITEICIVKEEILFIDDSENEYFIGDFGKSIFLTREEAKAALKESGDIRQQDRHSR